MRPSWKILHAGPAMQLGRVSKDSRSIEATPSSRGMTTGAPPPGQLPRTLTSGVIAGMTETCDGWVQQISDKAFSHAPDRPKSRRFTAPLVGAGDRGIGAIHVRGRCVHRQRG